MGKIFRAIAFFTSVILSASVGAVSNASTTSPQLTSTPAPTIARVIEGDCVGVRPQIVFEFPADAKPSYWEIIMPTAYGAIGKFKIEGNSIQVLLETQYGKKEVRARLVYTLPNGQELRVHGDLFSYTLESLKFRDSEYCKAWRAQAAEEERRKKLPALILKTIDYLGYSKINIDLLVSSSARILEVEAKYQMDSENWFTQRPAYRGSSNLPGELNLQLSLPTAFRQNNIVALQFRARNDTGWGDWINVSTGRPPGSSELVIAPDYSSQGYVLTTQPILMPPKSDFNLRTNTGCTLTTVQLQELSSSGIQPGDTFRIETALEEGEYRLNEAHANGEKQIITLASKHNPTQASFNVRLCPRDTITIEPRYLRVKITKISSNEFIEGKIKVVLERAGKELARYRAAGLCEPSSDQKFGNNVVVEQEQFQKSINQKNTLKGTLFRAGFIAPNQTFSIYRKSSTATKPIFTGKTDVTGQFSFSFSVAAVKKKGEQESFFFVVDEASGPNLPFNRVFDFIEAPLNFVWGDKGLAYVVSSNDWVPKHSSSCSAAVDQIPWDRDGDEKNHVAWFVAKQLYYGMKGKKTQSREEFVRSTQRPAIVTPSSGGSGGSGGSGSSAGSGGSKCTWVNGYTRKSGTRVSGHWRCG